MKDANNEGGTVVSRAGTNLRRGHGAHEPVRAWVSLWLLAALALPALGVLAGPPSSGVSPLFELAGTGASPFPSDFLTVLDDAQATGLRVNLPKPDCAVRTSDCQDIDVLNTLDGFNLQPRLAIPFSGAIDPASVSSDTVFLLALDGSKPAAKVGVNYVVWDPATRVLYAESDQFLSQASRYALIVTTGVRDAAGDPIGPSTQFDGFRKHPANDAEAHRYKQALLDAVYAARHAGTPEKEIAVASVFTTQSITAVAERTRDYVRSLDARADFALGPGGARTVFAFSQVTSIVYRQHTRVSPDGFTNVNVPLNGFAFEPGTVGSLAYGRVTAPSFLRPDVTFNVVGTKEGVPPVTVMEDLYFNLLLPSGPEPADGWPVAMIGIGGQQSKESSPPLLAPILAKHGIASMFINPIGRGFGPLSTNTVRLADSSVTTFLAGGRSRDVDGNKVIGNQEGGLALAPNLLLSWAHALKQTALDRMVLVRAVQLGMDVDGDGAPDLDADRMYYLGWSLGTQDGTPLVAMEPAFRASVLNAMAGPQIHLQVLGNQRNIVGNLLASRIPSLINVGGIVFNENFPLRGQPPLVNTVAGAIAIQEYMDRREWAMQSGEQVAYAARLRTVPGNDAGVRGVLVQTAKGDMTQPNPVASRVIRAGGLEAYTTYYRHDLACAANPCTTAARKNPHTFLIDGVLADAYFAAVTRGAQEQAAQFLASDGLVVIHPTPTWLFEVPIVLPLPEAQNFIP